MLDYVPVKEAAKKLGLSRDALLRRIQRRSVKAVKIGWIWVVPAEEVARLLEAREPAQ